MIFKHGNKRQKVCFQKSFFLNLLFPFLLITITLAALPLYTPWIFNKDVNALRDWLPIPFNFVKFHKKRILNQNIASMTNVLLAREPEENASIPTEKIWIENSGLEKMNHQLLFWNIPLEEEKFKVTKRKKPRVNGLLEGTDKKQLRARINIRGSRPNHQLKWKPSLKVHLKKNKTNKGFRDHIFISPEDQLGLRNWISAELGKKWNVLNNREEFIRLYINNKNYGLYNKVSPFNESFLIHSQKLPGPIFDFNIFNKQQFNIWKKFWPDPEAWTITEKKYRLLPQTKSIVIRPLKIGAIINFWDQLNKGSIVNYLEALNHYISKEQFAKYLAILAHGGERHYVDNHNALFWFNPSSGLIEPIINDQNGYGLTNPKNWIQSSIIKNEGAFVKAWFKSPLNQALYIEKLNELVSSFGSRNNIEKIIREQWNKVKSVAQTDLHLSYFCHPGRCFYPINKLDDEIENLISDINQRLDWIDDELHRDQIALVNKSKNDFEILLMGFSGVTFHRKDKKSFNFSNVKISNQYNKDIFQINGIKTGTLYPTKSIIKEGVEEVKFNDSYSFYTISGNPEDYIFTHRLSKKRIEIQKPKADLNVNQLKTLAGANYLNFKNGDTSQITLGPGRVEILEPKIFNPGQPVFIKAGTEIYLDKNVQVIVQGPLVIEGTGAKPVTIKPLNPQKPFGVLALLGKETKGSKINYLRMEGGSVGYYYNLKFSGMFSIHDCPDIEIKNSNFGKNYIGDDAVHIINSTAIIKDSIFENSKNDALDLDLVNGDLVNNQFINPGNDGLDLSMGKTIIDKSRFIGCKDKCVSVGEGAETKISNSYFQNCNNAVAVKDRSNAILQDSIIDRCNIGWNSYRKKWRWELGGKGKIINSKFINMRSADISGDNLSSVSLIKQNLANLKIKGKIKVNALN
jgi:uncharacterized protein YjbI with pentapeptide repeats